MASFQRTKFSQTKAIIELPLMATIVLRIRHTSKPGTILMVSSIPCLNKTHSLLLEDKFSFI